jgi:hypothetical protein
MDPVGEGSQGEFPGLFNPLGGSYAIGQEPLLAVILGENQKGGGLLQSHH